MTEENNLGVQEGVADPHAEPQAQGSSQEINWQKANETMAEQKQRLSQLEEQNRTYQQQLAVFQNYMNQQQQPQSAQSDDSFAGISDDDVVTGAELKQAVGSMLSQKEKAFQERLEQQTQQLALMELRAKHSDYDTVVGNAIKMAETNPALADAIRTSKNPGLLAYEIGKAYSPKLEEQKASAQQIVANAQRPGSVGAAATGTSGLGRSEYFKSMSERDFNRHIEAIKRGAL